MYLEEIILDGFKSYATRTVISDFDSKFNAITGLNGSGKSNILDAICFVLGITNLSQVRVKNLQELVYKQGQAGITKATVTLVFNNTDSKQSPIGYEQYDRITVTRQVVIGGRNKYMIQGHTAQVNQVQNLFHSVQLNVNNPHFLIMQGHITKVLNMKPLEILGMVEEACGTRLYEMKKNQAEKTMEKKDSKVKEIDSIIAESITPTLEKLRAQRTAYLQWASNSTEIERLRRQQIAFDYFEACNFLKEGNRENRLLTEEIQLTDANGKMSKRTKELEESIKEMELHLKESKSLEEVHNEETVVSKQLVKENSNYTNNIQSLERDKEELSRLKERKKKSIQSSEELDGRLRSKNIECENAKVSHEEEKARLEELEKQLDQIERGEQSSEGSGYTELINAQHRDQVEKESKLKQLKQRLGSAEKDVKHLEKAISSLKRENEQDEGKRVESEQKIQQFKFELNSLNYEEQEYEVKKKSALQVENTIKSLKNQLEECESQLDTSLQFRYTDPEPHFDHSRVKGLVAELIQVRDPKYNQAVEVTAGGKLYQVVVDTEKTGELLLKKGNLQRRVTIIPLNRIKHNTIPPSKVKEAEKLASKGSIHLALTLIGYEEEVQEAIEYVFGSTLVCDNLEIARKVTFNKSIRLRSVTLDGDIFEPSGVIEGGSRTTVNPILPLLSRVNDLRQSLKEKEEEYGRVNEQFKQLSSKRQRYLSLKNKLELESHNLDVLMSEGGDELKKKEEEYEVKQKEYNDYRREYEELVKEKEAGAKRLMELKKKSEELKKMDKSDVNSLKKKINECRKAEKTKEKTKEKSMNEYEELELESKELKKEIGELEEVIQKEEKAIEEFESKIKELSMVVSELEEKHTRLKKEESDLKKELSECSKELKKLAKEKEECEKKMEENGKRLATIKQEKEKLRKLRNEADKRQKALLKEHSWLKEEESEFGKEGGNFDFQSLDMSEVKQKISLLEEEQESLGRKLNKKVLGMMEKAESEYQDLTKKREIITRDKEQIENVIKGLNDRKEQTLKDTYKKVNEDFASIFSTLLPGASACLRPTDGDILNGLEVHVAFGGKEKESLSELSGGQRSLLALSLVLSLLLFKPAPMYILDEVDAALDLSHTQNIGKMLRKHFGQSQFIVVSLKEGMFTNANVIFRTKFVDGVSTVSRTLGQIQEEEKGDGSKRRKTK